MQPAGTQLSNLVSSVVVMIIITIFSENRPSHLPKLRVNEAHNVQVTVKKSLFYFYDAAAEGGKGDRLLRACCHSCLRAYLKNFSCPLRCREVCSCVFMELPAE